MSVFRFTFRHLRRHWRLNVAALVGLILAVALLASLPGYAAAIAARELGQNLEEAHFAERSLLITGKRSAFNNDVYESLRRELGELFKDRLEVRDALLSADPRPPSEQVEGTSPSISSLHMYSLDRLAEIVRVLEGRLPDPILMSDFVDPLKPPPIPTVIGVRAAESTGIAVGDRLTAGNDFHRLDIVGIVEPLDPSDDLWGGDLSAFELAIDATNPNEDVVTLPLIIASGSMRTISPKTFRNVFPHEVLWRVLLQHQRINADNAAAVHARLINIQTQMETSDATVSTGLVQILADYMAQLSRVRTSLFLLVAQAFFFVLYALGVLSSLMLDQSQSELATLSGRGANTWQITLIFAVENLALAAPAALLLGPGLALGGLRVWAEVSGQGVPAALPRESWLLSGVAGGLGWLALVVPVALAARGNLVAWRQSRARPARRSAAQKLYLDVFLLILGGLLYWQLNQSGSFVVQRLGDIQLADPLLLLGPTFLLVATALIFLRLFPALLQMVAWVFQRMRGLMLPLGLRRLARDPLKPSRLVLLVSLTAGLVLFSTVYGSSLSFSQEEMAHYLAGADLRISMAPSDQPGDQVAPQGSQFLDQLATLPGVRTVSPAFRGSAQTEEGRLIQLLAVDPVTFAQVARLPVNVTNLKVATLMRVIGSGAGEDGLPAVFASAALPSKKGVGDESFLNLAGRRLPLSVRGTISNFPTLTGSFVIVSLPDLEAQVDLDTAGMRRFGSREAWLAVDPGQHERLIAHTALEGRILDDARGRLSVIQADALAQGTGGALRLNTLTLALLSVAAFWLVQFFTAQQRVLEFSVLRAMGLAVRQLLTLLVTEGALVLALGLAAGTAIGYGLSRVMIPYLSRALAGSLGGVTIKHIVVDWPTIAQLYGLLIVFYGLALALLLVVLMRTGIQGALRMGEE
jgi:hypothetical protein